MTGTPFHFDSALDRGRRMANVADRIVDMIGRMAKAEQVPVHGIAPCTGMETEPPGLRAADLLPGAQSMICFGLPLPRDVYQASLHVTELVWRSQNLLYRRLDSLSLAFAMAIEAEGARSLPVFGCTFFEADSTLGSELLETTPENYRQILSRARKRLCNFMNDRYGMMYEANPCRCANRIQGAMKAGLIDPQKPRFNLPYLHRVRDFVAEKAENKAAALKAHRLFVDSFREKYPKAVACLQGDDEALFSFYEMPAAHWQHIRSTNVIESVFATVRLRTEKTKGCGTRLATLTMVFKLMQEAQKSWRRLDDWENLTLVFEGRRFVDGVLQEDAVA